MAITIGQQTGSAQVSGTSVSTGATISPNLNQLLVAWLRVQRTGTNSPSAPTISDNTIGGGTWLPLTINGGVPAFYVGSVAPLAGIAGWYKVVNAADAANSSFTATCGWTGAATGIGGGDLILSEYDGFVGIPTLDPSCVIGYGSNMGESFTGGGAGCSASLGLSGTAAGLSSLIVATFTANGSINTTPVPTLTNGGASAYPNLTTEFSAGPIFVAGWTVSTAQPPSGSTVVAHYNGNHDTIGATAVFFDLTSVSRTVGDGALTGDDTFRHDHSFPSDEADTLDSAVITSIFHFPDRTSQLGNFQLGTMQLGGCRCLVVPPHIDAGCVKVAALPVSSVGLNVRGC